MTILVKKAPERKKTRVHFADFEPFFTRSFLPDYSTAQSRSKQALMNVYHHESYTRIQLALPGYTKEELLLNIEDSRLTIESKNKETEKPGEKMNYRLTEFGNKPVKHVFQLADDIDGSKIDATMNQGILEIILHRKPEMKPRQITVK